MPDSETSSWNTLGIPENTSGLNFLSLNEKNNPWTPPIISKLISLSETSNTESKTPKREDIEDLLDKSLSNLNGRTSNIRFRPNTEDNPFCQPTNRQVPVLSTFSTWESTDNVYYYNIFKNKGLARRKVTFRQTIITFPSNLLSRKQLRYQTRYQTRNNNSSEESPDNDDDDDDDDDDNNSNQENNLSNRQPNRPPNQPSSPSPNQNMNDRNRGGNNFPDGKQNNIITQALIALA